MSAPLPVFGPTGEPFGHEDDDHQLIVRVAYKLTWQQVTAALRVSFAQLGGERAPADMTVDEIRAEVEEFFAAAGILDCDETIARIERHVPDADERETFVALDAAIRRAFRLPAIPVRPSPRYFNGQVAIVTHDAGEIVLDEPAWCVGHAWQPNPHRRDITHNAHKVRSDSLSARISWAPFIETHPVLAVELNVAADYQAEDIPGLVAELRTAADRLERLAVDAIRLRGAS